MGVEVGNPVEKVPPGDDHELPGLLVSRGRGTHGSPQKFVHELRSNGPVGIVADAPSFMDDIEIHVGTSWLSCDFFESIAGVTFQTMIGRGKAVGVFVIMSNYWP
jgi:hypothetical protein